MATLVLGAAGAAAGSALLPSFSVLGGSITGAVIGKTIGAIAGSYVDDALFGSSGQQKIVENSGHRLSDLQVLSSAEGTVIPRIYGRARLGGQVIWATHYEEEVIRSSQATGGGGGKGGLTGGGGGRQSRQTVDIEYRYYANFAVVLCEGEITRMGRVWADGKELNLSDYTIRVHHGSTTQQADSLITAKQGAGNTPAYRGTAYVVFDRMPLARFGNRIPQLNFEIYKAVDEFEKHVTAVTLIPSAGEFIYEKDQIVRDEGGGITVSENIHSRLGGTDWTIGLNQLESTLPNCKSTGLFVSWFGNDLRAGHCDLRPGVEVVDKITSPDSWEVGGENRKAAHLVSEDNGRPAYGGTPSDKSVISAIEDLKLRGLNVTYYPFILMDVPEGNQLPTPYGGTAGQPLYPWRGRITCDPAPGEPGSVDKTVVAASQIASFVGACKVSDFSITGGRILYSGPDEWSFRRFILHNAHLAKAAGGVHAFIIGSEMRGLSWVRSSASSYPFVAALIELAADVKAVLGTATKVTYGADWTEYFGHQPQDGSGDVYFHLDPLWASSHIDAIGIDLYWPLADWRDGSSHLDYLAGTATSYDLDYLKSNVAGGEGYDWFYASRSDRDNQVRTPITDGTGKPWTFRYKDIKNWWLNSHYNRPGGVESGAPTAWIPQSKPFWITEVGCPAADKGANQPNVFFDPKSSESFFPYYSRGIRDDLIQRRYLQAIYEYYDTTHEDYIAGSNPSSNLFDGRMVDQGHIYAYTWDARPYPAFPYDTETWGDGANWTYGHWLTGRLGGGPLAAVVAAILTEYNFTHFSVAGLVGNMDGYVIDNIMSARDALQPLELAFFFDSYESEGIVNFAHRGRVGPVLALNVEDLVEENKEGEVYQLTRAQETDLPVAAKLSYIDASLDYRQAVVDARRLAVMSDRISTAQLPIVLGQDQAQGIAESWLHDSWSAREQASFTLPPSKLGLEPTDLVTLSAHDRRMTLRLTEVGDGIAKSVKALTIEPEVYTGLRSPIRTSQPPAPSVFGGAISMFMDLPLLRGDEVPHAGYVTSYASPWPGGISFYRSPDIADFRLKGVVTTTGILGETQTEFHAGPTGRWDYGNQLTIKLNTGELQSISALSLFGGSNIAAIENEDGEWEVIQFLEANLIAEKTYVLSTFLRGQAGTEQAMRAPLAAGSRFVLIDESLAQIDMTVDEIGLDFNWKYGPVNRDIGDQSYRDEGHKFVGLGLRPLSPVHVRGEHRSQELDIRWIRRTRIGGDSWEGLDVPLSEETESYEVDILEGSSVKRTLSSSHPTVRYSEADQIADWGAVQSSYDLRVFQLSAVFGRGASEEVRIAL